MNLLDSFISVLCIMAPFQGTKQARASKCPDMNSIENGKIRYWRRGSRIQFLCNKGYVRNGTRRLDCQENGTWDGEPPVCLLQPTRNSIKSISTTKLTTIKRATRRTIQPSFMTTKLPTPKSALLSRGSAPTTNGSFTTTKESFTTTKESFQGLFPTTKETFPTTNESFTTTKESFPTTKETFPTTNESFTTTKESFPTTKGLLPTTKEPFPTTNESFTTTKESFQTTRLSSLTTKTKQNPVKGQAVKCPDISSLENGEIRYWRRGSRIKFLCNRGYIRHGSRRLDCQADGNWDGAPPVCIFQTTLKSIEPTSPMDTSTTKTTTQQSVLSTTRTTALQTKPHLTSSESLTITSVTNMTTATTPVSTRPAVSTKQTPVTGQGSKCPDISTIQNGKIRYWRRGSRIQFLCDKGYIRHGSRRLDCLKNGAWDGEPPVCILPTTSKSTESTPTATSKQTTRQTTKAITRTTTLPTTVSSSTTTVTALTTRKTVSTKQTTMTGQALKCPDISRIENGKIRYWRRGSRIQFLCNKGYIRHGSRRLDCLKNGAWDGEPPVCILPTTSKSTESTPTTTSKQTTRQTTKAITRTTALPTTVSSSTTTVTALTTRKTVSTKQTQITGQALKCQDISGIENGEIRYWRRGSRIQFLCNKGYIRHGSRRLDCQEDGTWDGEPPVCILPTTAKSTETMSTVESARTQTSTQRFVISTTRRAELTTSKSSPITTVTNLTTRTTTVSTLPAISTKQTPVKGQAVKCPDISSLENGEIRYWRRGSRIQFLCNKGYVRHGSRRLDCLKNGTWDGEPPVCLVTPKTTERTTTGETTRITKLPLKTLTTLKPTKSSTLPTTVTLRLSTSPPSSRLTTHIGKGNSTTMQNPSTTPSKSSHSTTRHPTPPSSSSSLSPSSTVTEATTASKTANTPIYTLPSFTKSSKITTPSILPSMSDKTTKQQTMSSKAQTKIVTRTLRPTSTTASLVTTKLYTSKVEQNTTRRPGTRESPETSHHPGDETLKPLMIGLGVGIVAGLIIIGAITWVCFRWFRNTFYFGKCDDRLELITNSVVTSDFKNGQYLQDDYPDGEELDHFS